MTRSKLDPDHPDIAKMANYTDCKTTGLSHHFSIKSSYASINELPVTNYKPFFEGAIDYIWNTPKTLIPTGILGPVDEQWRKSVVGFPHPHIPSDHIPLMSEFRWRPLDNSIEKSTSSSSGKRITTN